jgi:hypothetical protein
LIQILIYSNSIYPTKPIIPGEKPDMLVVLLSSLGWQAL